MAAMFLQPWRFLLRSTFVYFFCISLLPSPSFSQSDSPRNIETYFPNDALVPAPPPLSNLPPSPSPPQKSSSNGSEIRRAVLITAASTVVVAAAFFFFLQKCAIARRRRDRVAVESALRPGPLPPETVLAREGFTRFGGNVKGLIVDENGLDVLYWRKLQRDKSESFRKEVVNREDDDGGDGDGGGEEKKVIYYKKKEKSEPVSEIPLLRGKSSTSHSVIHHEIHENYKHATNPPPIKIKSFSFKTVESSETESSPPPPTTTMRNQGTSAPPPPPPPPPIPLKKASPSPVPPPPPPPLPISLKKGPSPPPPPAMALTPSSSKPPAAPKGGSAKERSSNAQVKLKPLHWDKVNPDSDHSMVWDKIDRGSFSFDGDLMEALFGYVAKKSPEQNSTSPSQIFILDPRKSQNTAIVIKSLGITREELIDAFINGHDFTSDILDRLSRIAPTKDEQLAILDFDGDPRKLADAESFLFHLLKAVPSAFTRLNALLFKANYNPEITHHKQCLQMLDAACKELRAHGLFIKLLEAILKAGNRMNAGTTRGNAQAFNLTALLKLSDVKSVDQKTTLLHFVVEEVVRSEGKRCLMNRNLSRSNSNRSNSSSDSSQTLSKEEQEKEYLKHGLPIIGGLSAEFINVKKAAGLDHDALTATCTALMTRAKDTRQVLTQIEGNQKGDRFEKKMIAFLDSVEEETKLAREEETKVMEFVKRTTDYYQAGALKGKNPFQLFVIISDFLDMVDKVCLDITKNLQKRTTGGSSSGSRPMRNAVKFPVLPPNFLSDRYRSEL